MKPNFLSRGLLVAGVIFASVSISPAQAAGLKGTLSFEGINPGDNLVNSIANPTVDFNNADGLFSVDAATNGFAQFAGNSVVVNDITNAFGSNFDLFSIKDNANNVVATYTVKRFINPTFVGGAFFVSEARGFITTSAGASETFSSLLTFNTNGAGADEVDFNLATVPTPAMLPGLIGMGVAAVRRRRKSDELEMSEA